MNLDNYLTTPKPPVHPLADAPIWRRPTASQQQAADAAHRSAYDAWDAAHGAAYREALAECYDDDDAR